MPSRAKIYCQVISSGNMGVVELGIEVESRFFLDLRTPPYDRRYRQIINTGNMAVAELEIGARRFE